MGAPVAASRHGRSDNSIELPIQIDYQEISAADWTSVETSVSPDDGSSTVLTRASNLELGSEYRMRAAYTNADSYTVSDNATTKAFIRISSAPYRVEALSDLIDAPNRKYRVRVAWESPEIEVDDNLTYRYATRLNSSDAMSNPIGQEQVLETVFDYSAAGGELLQIEVNNTFSCLQPDGNQWTECQLSYDGRDYVIPAGDGWSTPWSAPAFVNLSARTAAASGRGTDRAPHESVTQALALGFDTAGVPEEERPIETLAVALGTIFALAIGSTVGYMSKGPKTSRVALGAIIFFALLAGVATVMFGVPEALVMVLATSIIILAIAFLIRRFAV